VKKIIFQVGGASGAAGGNLTVIKIIDAFTFYGFDILLLAVLTAATVQIFKLTFLKRCKNKLYTFLPFGLGAFYYAAYTVLVNWNFTILLDGYTDILEHGFSVGSLATLLYVLYEQFVRDKKASTPAEGIISTLIEGFVPSETVEKAAKLIAEAIEKDVTGEGAARAAEILSDNCAEGITEKDIKLLSKLIIETLSNLNEPKP
jgi:hypothetical protein